MNDEVAKRVDHHNSVEEQDPVDAVLPVIPVVIPAFGAAIMFLLAFIAVTMA